ncbi:MAG: hypothetical protein EBS53_07395, partial [Bacteroidetes bacterium]|nr:hypothetical protein [Bacteroidota bacterium]
MNTLYSNPASIVSRLFIKKALFSAFLVFISTAFGYFGLNSAHAQISVNLGNASTCTPGSVVTVPITVTNFNNIGAVSLDLNYSATALTY